MVQRLLAIIRKELIGMLRDRRARLSLIIPPIIQLVIFAQAATMEVKNIELAVVDLDRGPAAFEVMHRLRGSPSFESLPLYSSVEAARAHVEREEVIGILVLPSGFSADIAAGRPTTTQLLLDGRRSNAAGITAQYVSGIVEGAGVDLAAREHEPSMTASLSAATPELVINNWFNPNLDYKWFILPNLVGNLSLGVALMLTALSVSRERELGTFDQTLVSPATPVEIAMGKLLPPLFVAFVQTSLYLVLVTLVYGVPFRGSIPLFYASVLTFAAACAGIGLFISSIAQTQQQAFLGAFAVLLPFALLSGFATPVENMPLWLQLVTGINPLAHMLRLMQGLFLKDASALSLVHLLGKLGLIAVVTVTSAVLLFRRRAT
ncbi:MAG: ABC transporter permease [Gammaproteobacteria bacterium]